MLVNSFLFDAKCLKDLRVSIWGGILGVGKMLQGSVNFRDMGYHLSIITLRNWFFLGFVVGWTDRGVSGTVPPDRSHLWGVAVTPQRAGAQAELGAGTGGLPGGGQVREH